jgi:hypothetical protein
MTLSVKDNKKLSTGFACLPSDGALVQISLVLLLILQSKYYIYKQHSLDGSKFILVLYR